MKAMFQLLEESPEIKDGSIAKSLNLIGGCIEFRDVHFGYLQDQKILDGVSFVVPAGRSVAIVGTSGSGKSTILILLFRFFNADYGAKMNFFPIPSARNKWSCFKNLLKNLFRMS
ncbi:hypothetical protein HPP92_027406 [Vanilla planifolia]|uniref:ABC transporter domain-containing protein n=1 Tax=Vanilla planifolia TaxID=51239 RepID=A0A835U7V1_VANPL|nr:hypothetical protein HPP92_027406 [Vanilla planifolia]